MIIQQWWLVQQSFLRQMKCRSKKSPFSYASKSNYSGRSRKEKKNQMLLSQGCFSFLSPRNMKSLRITISIAGSEKQEWKQERGKEWEQWDLHGNYYCANNKYHSLKLHFPFIPAESLSLNPGVLHSPSENQIGLVKESVCLILTLRNIRPLMFLSFPSPSFIYLFSISKTQKNSVSCHWTLEFYA